MTRVLVVDDEPSLVESVKFLLEQNGYEVLTASTGTNALEHAKKADLMLLDVMLPGMDGFEVCRTLRAQGYTAPILLLTAKSDEIDQVVGLELGADDYVTKPFRHRELLARVKAHLRRAKREDGQQQLKVGNLVLNPDRHEATLHGNKLDLTPKEYQLLQFLVENRGKALSRERILSAVWGYDWAGESRVVNVTIQRLRDKIDPDLVVTVRGVGYMLDV